MHKNLKISLDKNNDIFYLCLKESSDVDFEERRYDLKGKVAGIEIFNIGRMLANLNKLKSLISKKRSYEKR
jgi:uncharacterized protein YuzE